MQNNSFTNVFLQPTSTLDGLLSSCGAECPLLKNCLSRVSVCSVRQDTTTLTPLCISRQCFFFFHFTTAERDYMLLNKQRLSNRFFFFNFQDAALSRLLLIFHVPLH